MLRDAWEAEATNWIRWARAPGHDSYWRFHRDAFLSLVPGPGRLTLDLGSGEGRLGRDLVRLGHRVVAVDASPTLARAAASHPETAAAQVLGDLARLPLASGVADLALAFMSLQDVDEVEAAVAEVARVLEPGGRLVLAVVHPVNSAGAFAPGTGERPYVITESWFARRRYVDVVERDGYTMSFASEHRSLEDYAQALFSAGFVIEELREFGEPDPADKWHTMPLFLDLRAALVGGDGAQR